MPGRYRNLQEAARAAMDVQNACNLSGVVQDFADILVNVLWPAARAANEGTDWVNQHPISQAFADKIIDLARARDIQTVFNAFDECARIGTPLAPNVR